MVDIFTTCGGRTHVDLEVPRPEKTRTVHIEETNIGEVLIKFTDRDVFVCAPDEARRLARRIIETADCIDAERAKRRGAPYR
jgi:hypothetical protein